MRTVMFCGVLIASLTTLSAQAPAGAPAQGRQTTPSPAPARPTGQTTPNPAPARPAQPAQAPPAQPTVRRPAAPQATTARGNLTMFVTSMAGAPLGDVRVQALGPTERGGTTDSSGRLTITGMQAGTYRLRFLNDEYVEFEREVVVRGGVNPEIDVSLRPAPPPKVVTVAAPPPPPAPAPAPVVGPIGQPQVIAGIASLVTRAFLDGPRKELLLSCSANTRLTLVQMTQEQPVRLYESAEVTYYVLGGEGVARVDGKDTQIKQESLVFVPRGVSHSLAHRGRRNVPLVLISQLSGEPCEEAK